MLTESQIEDRLNYVTGSDAAVICGLSPYMNIIDLYLIKTRQKTQPDISRNPHVIAGNYLEEIVIKMFMDETGLCVNRYNDIIFSEKNKWMAANIDGLVEKKEFNKFKPLRPFESYKISIGNPETILYEGTPDTLSSLHKYAILECKTSFTYDGWGDAGDDTRIPKHYLLQCAHYCAVTESNLCYVAVLFQGYDFRVYKYNRNMELESKLIEAERIFWEENVLKGICPEPKTENEVKSMLWDLSDEPSIANSEIEEMVNQYKIIKEGLRSQEKELQSVRDKICSFMGNKQFLVDSFGKPLITWKESKSRKSIDLNKLKNDFPEIYDKCLKESDPSRMFLLKDK